MGWGLFVFAEMLHWYQLPRTWNQRGEMSAGVQAQASAAI